MGRMNLPTGGFEDIVGDMYKYVALFDHMDKLHAHEEDKALQSGVCVEKDIV